MRGGFRVQHCSHPVFDSDMLPRESPVSVGSVGLKGVVFVKCDRYHNSQFPIVRACGQFKQEFALLGIHTPIGSAFNPVVYLYCLLQTEIKKVSSFTSMFLQARELYQNKAEEVEMKRLRRLPEIAR